MTVQQLGPEEVGARVSAILEAAERDARAVIAAAYREAAAAPAAPATLEDVAQALEALSRRVDAIERAIGATPRTAPAPEPARAPRDDAVRVRAVELSLAGHSREGIARELTGTMAPADVERLLDEVLAG